MTEQGDLPVRPRFGTLTRARDGSQMLLVFVPTKENPKLFLALQAADWVPVVYHSGDEVHIDVLGPGQGVTFTVDPRDVLEQGVAFTEGDRQL